jgi:predicted RND superfamily exporter protein
MILFRSVYKRQLQFPIVWLIIISLVALCAAWQTRNFAFDASSDTLVVQGDPGLETYREMAKIFGGDEFLILAWRPKGMSHFSRDALDRLAALQREVTAVDGVAGVLSVLDVPLIQSPPLPIEKMASEYRTLRDVDIDLALARKELTTSVLFRDYLISKDGSSSVLRVDLEQDERLIVLQKQLDGAAEGQLDKGDIEESYRQARLAFVDGRQALIDKIRVIKQGHEQDADIYISGVPMIAADMIDFVKSDLSVFGLLVLSVIIVLLAFFFRRARWVLLPLLISAVSIVITTGVLAFVQKPVTVVSSNFISLLAILCISFSIHLIVRYRELLEEDPDSSQNDLVLRTMESKFAPCFYTALTTILAFGSMIASKILPIEDFGWMMCLGMVVAFIVTYVVFPSVLLLLGKGRPSVTLGSDVRITIFFSRISRQFPRSIIVVSLMVAVVAGYGLSLVSYDNRFIDYFDDDTDIYKGMSFIDEHLGGTVPFDVFIQMDKYEAVQDDFFAIDKTWPERYWFTADRVDRVRELHEFVEKHNATGKVISIATLETQARAFNDGDALTSVELAYVLGKLPETIRDQLLTPYASPKRGLIRINARTKESGSYYSRDDLIASIKQKGAELAGIEKDDVVVTGMMVLFNDMLKSLAKSQIKTLMYVVGATLLMFTMLLGSAVLALVALIPNVIAAAGVTAVMGYASIPLDMMTITIAAISIGIGVDDAVHYLHRFRQEFKQHGDVYRAVEEAHQSIGQAMYFTSAVIFLGFSVLVFSNFLPTVYFGLLTALAMLMALIANLTLLPALLIVCYRKNAQQC